MKAIRTLLNQTAIYGLSSIVGRFLNYLLVPLYTNIFSPSEYGIVTELYAYSSFLLIVFTYGMETAFFRFVQDERYQNKVYPTAILSLLSSSLIFLLIFSFLIPYIGKLLHYNNQIFLLWILLLILITDSMVAIPFAYLRQQNKAWKFASLKIINILTNIFFNILFLVIFPYLLKKGYSLNYLYKPEIGVGYVFISNLIANVLTLILVFPYKLKFIAIDFNLLKAMLKYSFPLLIAGLAGMINETFDRIILKHLITDKNEAMHQLGIYGANYKISILMTLFIQTFRFAAEPFFFNQAKEKNSKELYAQVMKYFVVFGLFIFLAVMLNIHFIQYFIGEKFREGLHIVPILLLANLFLGIFFNLSIWYKLNNLTFYGALLALFGAIVTVILNFILIPKMGYTGAAWTTLICYVSMTVVSFILSQKHFPIRYPLKEIFLYFILAIAFYSIAQYITISSTIIKTFLHNLILIFFVAIVVFREKKYLKNI